MAFLAPLVLRSMAGRSDDANPAALGTGPAQYQNASSAYLTNLPTQGGFY